MNQILAVAVGGSFGAVFRFLVSSGVYQWLGRGFPFGTLAVNIVGSFLLGLLTEALIVQRISHAHDYRFAILIGFIGAFTTFSTFSLETFYLIEQGQWSKAFANVLISVFSCILAVWLGLLCSRGLFYGSQGVVTWRGLPWPYALLVINSIGAYLIGLVATLAMARAALAEPSFVTLMAVVIGAYLILSGLYIVLYLLDQGFSFVNQMNFLFSIYALNTVLCLLMVWLGFLTVGKN